VSDYLVIASLVVPIAEGQFKENEREKAGSQTRAFAGNLRSTERWNKRSWSATTALMLSADIATLKTAVQLGAQVTVSGDAMGGSVTCVVTIGETADTSTASTDALGFMRTLALTIREV